MAPSVSVVIRCLNEEAHIGRLLAGLMEQRLQPHQIIIVDSGSTDATLAIAGRFPVEILHIDPASFSFGRSLNVGCRAATGDVIAIVSAHVYPLYDSWLSELVAPFENPATALTYGRQVGDETTRYSERQIMRQWFPNHSDWRQEHPFCNNANAAVRRSVWEVLPYDEELTGLEDMAWAHRALQLGHVIAYVAEAPVAHVHWESWSQLVNRYRREAIAHRRIMHDQRMGRLEAVRLALANIASDYVHAAREGQLRRNIRSIPWFRTAQFRGTYSGFTQRGEVSAVLRRRFYYPVELGRPRVPLDTSNGAGQRIQYDELSNERRPEVTR
jgi:glycosyltransferase involved in cell wall biosynthesis